MGKITIFQCDYCNKEYKSSIQVKIIDGDILDGNENIVFEGDKDQIICNECLITKFEKITEEETVVEIDNDISEKRLLKKINNIKDEDEFIKNIGYVNRDNFTKVYKDSLINHYYPIDDEEEKELVSFNIPRTANVIHTVFASVPQVKRMKILVNEENDEFAIANIDLFEE
jgi:hypothetical protein